MQKGTFGHIITRQDGRFVAHNLQSYNSNKLSPVFALLPYVNPGREAIEILKFSLADTFAVDEIEPQRANARIDLSMSGSRESYIKKVNFLKDKIQQGVIYEINFCVEFFAENVEIDPVSVFFKLNKLTRAPYASMVNIGEDYIISASPELFIKKEGDKLYSKPIKGTIKRGNNEYEDKVLSDILYNSLKERTENVMAVDVARNDLSRLASRGTVQVNKLYNIETYETVHHMVSTVSCDLKPGKTFEEIINVTFPMASMTGAPKISAMDLIDETEEFKRGFYSGAMGIITAEGDFQLSVNIRSIFYNTKTKRLSIAVGSAITHLCDPEKEYEECLLKANALLTALNATIKN